MSRPAGPTGPLADDRSQPGLAHCYRHPLRETGVRCIRCDRPICPDCMRPAAVGFHCPDDVEVAARTIRQPRTVAGAPAVARRAYVIWSLIAANVVMYLVTARGSHHGLNDPASSKLFGQWDLIPYRIAYHHEYIRLVTSAFLHLNLTHLLFNMVALAVVGPFLEQALGWWRTLATYLLAALGGSVAVYLFGNHLTAVAGASGAIYGLFAAALVLARRLGLDLRALAATVALNFVFTFSFPGISIEGHIGGFVTGALAALCVVGPPQRRSRVDLRVQVTGLAAVGLVLLGLIVFRTDTFVIAS